MNIEGNDPLYDEAVLFVRIVNKVSISAIQRKFRIGFNRAARLIHRMELEGVCSMPDAKGKRELRS